MKNKTEVYTEAEKVVHLIEDTVLNISDDLNTLTKMQCYNILLYTRTIRTSIDLIDEQMKGRLESILLEDEISQIKES